MSSIDNFIKELGGNFISLVKSIGVLDVFDIILVAVLIYYAFNFLRNRRAGKLVFGVVILFALQLLSDLLGLIAADTLSARAALCARKDGRKRGAAVVHRHYRRA